MLKFGVPYGVSTLAAYFVAGRIEHWGLNQLLTVLLCWAAENGGYYLTAKISDRFLPVEEKIFKESSESLKQLLIVEGLDGTIRLLLLWLCPKLLDNQEQGVALGSLIADITFALSLNHSHRLVAIYSKSSRVIRQHLNVLTNDPAVLELRLNIA